MSPARLVDLPAEIINCILEELCVHCQTLDIDEECCCDDVTCDLCLREWQFVLVLGTLTRTSRWLNCRSSPHLYHRPTCYRPGLLARTLMESPQLAIHVRHLSNRQWKRPCDYEGNMFTLEFQELWCRQLHQATPEPTLPWDDLETHHLTDAAAGPHGGPSAEPESLTTIWDGLGFIDPAWPAPIKSLRQSELTQMKWFENYLSDWTGTNFENAAFCTMVTLCPNLEMLFVTSEERPTCAFSPPGSLLNLRRVVLRPNSPYTS